MRIRRAAIAPFLVALLAGCFLAAGVPSKAAATGEPCWQKVIDDWLDNGTIDHRYKAICYQQALKHIPEDLRDYSNITDAITAALQGAVGGKGGSQGGTGTGQGGGSSSGGSGSSSGGGGSSSGGSGSSSGGGGSTGPAGNNRHLQAAPERSYYRRAIDNLGSTSADSLPIPLLVLAGLGSALLLTAGGLAARKRLKARAKPPS
jgi:hypothetical protein